MDKITKENFIDFLISRGVISFSKDGEHYSLKSGRLSPYFINIGEINSGKELLRLAEFYSQLLDEALQNFGLSDEKIIFYGIPEKAIPIAIALAIHKGNPFFYTRKKPKEYGEVTGKKEEKIKDIVGKVPSDDDVIIVVDDVITSGDTKYETYEFLKSMGNLEVPILLIAFNREEVGLDGLDAKKAYEERTKSKVFALVNTTDLYDYLMSQRKYEEAKRIASYLRAYGTKEAKEKILRTMKSDDRDVSKRKIINKRRSIIPACDFEEIEDLENLVKEIDSLDIIGGYKIGSSLAVRYGLERIVDKMKSRSEKPIIYDHQKAGSDIPEMSKKLVRVCKKAGVDALIVFPLSGSETARAFIYHSLENELPLIIGGKMTHRGFTLNDHGYIDDNKLLEVYRIAAEAGIYNFVIPGNQPEFVEKLTRELLGEDISLTYYATGIGAQGGSIKALNDVLRNKYANLDSSVDLHIIAGRSIYDSKRKIEDIRRLEEELLSY
ncbi:MAG: orotidine 5'-phosphate decarboxylase / HUMPS family protein [Candidatus Aenigmatarchaeota archaeon]